MVWWPMAIRSLKPSAMHVHSCRMTFTPFPFSLVCHFSLDHRLTHHCRYVKSTLVMSPYTTLISQPSTLTLMKFNASMGKWTVTCFMHEQRLANNICLFGKHIFGLTFAKRHTSLLVPPASAPHPASFLLVLLYCIWVLSSTLALYWSFCILCITSTVLHK